MSKEKYKILSLDGGGSWAILQAMALLELYPEKTNQQILSEFDLVVANSGGSLVLAAMLEKESPQEVFNLFYKEENRKSIFKRPPFFKRNVIRMLFPRLNLGPKYATASKIEGLQKLLKDYKGITLSKIPQEKKTPDTKYMIMGFDYDKQRASFFRSDLNSPSLSSRPGDDILLPLAVHASSNAPVNYFNKPATFKCGDGMRRFWDGAVGGNNNPALVGVIEALGYGIDPKAIRILSIGTGNNLLPIKGISPGIDKSDPILIKIPDKQDMFKDIEKMTKSILQEPPDAASYMAHMAIGGKASNMEPDETNIVRLNPLVQPFWNKQQEKWELPTGFKPEDFKALVKLEMDAVEQHELELIVTLGKLWLEDKAANQSLKYNSMFDALIGFDKFSEGKKRWYKIR